VDTSFDNEPLGGPRPQKQTWLDHDHVRAGLRKDFTAAMLAVV